MKNLFVIGMLLMVFFSSLQAQEKEASVVANPYESLEVEGRLLLFMDELDAVLFNASSAKKEKLKEADKALVGIDNKWNIYTQAHQATIASDEHLMDISVNYQETKQMVADSIQSLLHRLEAFEAFQMAEKHIGSQLEAYQEMHETSRQYSLVKQSAPLLEKLKTKEQLVFTELSGHYETAKSVSQEFPLLDARMEKVEEQFIELKGLSEKIQSAEYKPFLDRIKDYLYSFAAVAILLMFVNMVQSKIQAYKQMRKSAEEYKKMLRGGDNEYPSI